MGENCGNRAADCFCYQWNCGGRRLENSTAALDSISTVVASNISTVVASNSSEDAPKRRLWVCPQGFVGKDQCDSSPHASRCCGYSVPGENCGNRAADCFCYQWNCGGRRLENSTAALDSISTVVASNISTVVASNSSEDAPRRRLWVCPQGFVGKDQCDSSLGQHLDSGSEQHLDSGSEQQQRGCTQTTPLGVPSRIRRQGSARFQPPRFPVLRLLSPGRELREPSSRLLLLPVELRWSSAWELDRSLGQHSPLASLIATS